MDVVSIKASQTTPAPGPRAVDLVGAYDHYFQSGLYARRYPAPNPNMVRLIRSHLPADASVLDFGCGTGRYVGALLDGGARVFGYDPSPAALHNLRHRFQPAVQQGRLIPVGGALSDLTAAIPPGSLDGALLIFGVLAHIQGAAERLHTLRAIGRLLRPGGTIIVTVPNARRRFAKEQAACTSLIERGELEPGDIVYTRSAPDGPVELYYHLFSRGELHALLTDAGFVVEDTRADSVLPERAVLVLPAGHVVDRLLMAVTPVSLAYGFGAVATWRPPT